MFGLGSVGFVFLESSEGVYETAQKSNPLNSFRTTKTQKKDRAKEALLYIPVKPGATELLSFLDSRADSQTHFHKI